MQVHINGVEVIPIKSHYSRGVFREILKTSKHEPINQLNHTIMATGTIKAWHYHKIQTDYWYIVNGVMMAVLHDTDTKTTQEFMMGDNYDPFILKIPPMILHGLKVIQGPCNMIYGVTHEYNPEDELRLSYNDPEVGYDWFYQEIK